MNEIYNDFKVFVMESNFARDGCYENRNNDKNETLISADKVISVFDNRQLLSLDIDTIKSTI